MTDAEMEAFDQFVIKKFNLKVEPKVKTKAIKEKEDKTSKDANDSNDNASAPVTSKTSTIFPSLQVPSKFPSFQPAPVKTIVTPSPNGSNNSHKTTGDHGFSSKGVLNANGTFSFGSSSPASSRQPTSQSPTPPPVTNRGNVIQANSGTGARSNTSASPGVISFNSSRNPLASNSPVANSVKTITSSSSSSPLGPLGGARRAACGACPGCKTVTDCRRCGNCLDMVRNGGRGLKKQSCVVRQCSVLHPDGGTATRSAAVINTSGAGAVIKTKTGVGAVINTTAGGAVIRAGASAAIPSGAAAAGSAKSCGICPGCRTDCRKCGNCLDMVKYGGRGVRKMNCSNRTCTAADKKEARLIDLTDDRKTSSSSQNYMSAPPASGPVVGLKSSGTSSTEDTVRCKICQMILKNEREILVNHCKMYHSAQIAASRAAKRPLDGAAGQGPVRPLGPQLGGPQGAQGLQGARPPQGLQGLRQSQGPQGVRPSLSPQGLQGLRPSLGPQGLQGSRPSLWPQGPQAVAASQAPPGLGRPSALVRAGPPGPQQQKVFTLR